MPEHGCGDGKHWTAARLGVADPGFEPWVVLAKEFQQKNFKCNMVQTKQNPSIRNISKQFGNNQKCSNTLKMSPNNNLNWT